MILGTPPPEAPSGLWLLEGVSCSGKSSLLHRWRRECSAPVLWAAEDLATQRLFEPLDSAHHEQAVAPWLEALVGAWGALQAQAARAPWGAARAGFLAVQERFHLSAREEGGLGPEAFESLERALEALGARGVLLRVDPETLARRLEASLSERPEAWGRWVARRYGSLAEAVQVLGEAQAALEDQARGSRLPWHLMQA